MLSQMHRRRGNSFETLRKHSTGWQPSPIDKEGLENSPGYFIGLLIARRYPTVQCATGVVDRIDVRSVLAVFHTREI